MNSQYFAWRTRSKLLQLRKPTLHETAEKKVLLNMYAARNIKKVPVRRSCYATEPKKKQCGT